MSNADDLAANRKLPSDVKSLLERHPSRPWTVENLNHLLQELMAADATRDDSDSSMDGSTIHDSDLDILQNYGVTGREVPRFSRTSKTVDGRRMTREKKSSLASKAGSDSLLNKSKSESDSSQMVVADKARLSSYPSPRKSKRDTDDLKTRSSNLQVKSLRVKDSDIIDLGNISSRLMRKSKAREPEYEYLPEKIVPRVDEMVNAIKTAMKYNLQPDHISEEEVERRIELNRLLKSYRSELSSFGIKENSKDQYKGSFLKGIPTFQYKPLHPKKNREYEICGCMTCKVNRLWLETKRKKADELVGVLGKARKLRSEKVWNCQCKGLRPGFNNKNQMIMKIPVPQSMRPDELKKLNSVPRSEIYKHVTPAENKVNIKNAVVYKPQPARPIIQQEMMCHTNEMRCVMLPPPFTGKVTKFETPDWVVEYNKRYVYDYFFLQSKNIPNAAFLQFSYKKNLAVLIEEIIQGCMTRTDIFDDDSCQCSFLCSCAHKTVRKPNATLLDTVLQAKKYCAADLHEGNIYEAGDYLKTGDKTYFVCSKLCNARMKLHKQLHI